MASSSRAAVERISRSLLALLVGLAACAPVARPGADQYQVGFGTWVTLDGSRSARAERYAWRQIAGPRVALEGADAPIAHFRTRPIGEVLALGEYPGPVPVGQQPLYRFELATTGRGGRTARAEVLVTSASPVPATGGVPLDTDIYLNGGTGAGWSWTLQVPQDSQARLSAGETRTPHFRPDVRGAYTVLERRSGYNLFLWAGRFDLVPKDCGRSDCHAAEEKAWLGTRHAQAARHDPACVRCHTVGFDPGATNGGFDEACPKGRCTGDTAVLGVVHCLACHGPGFRSAANYAEGACQQCHDAPPKYTKVAEWRQAKMSRLTPGLEPAVQAVTPGCPDCHSSQGFVRWMKGKPGRALGPTYAAPVACPTCHDPHSARFPHQLRVYGEVKTRSGLDLRAVGEGALCATCHNAGLPRAQSIRERRAPHAPQAELIAARPAPWEPDLCVTCHVKRDHGGGGHTFAAQGPAADEAKRVRARIEPMLAAARERLRAAAAGTWACERRGADVEVRGGYMIVVDETGHDLGDCDQNGKIDGREKSERIADDRMAEEAYDFFLVERDRSFGAHNPALAERALAARRP